MYRHLLYTDVHCTGTSVFVAWWMVRPAVPCYTLRVATNLEKPGILREFFEPGKLIEF